MMSPSRPGRGNDCASSSTASRAPRRQATPGLDRDDRARAAPRPGHLSRDQDRAGPHARCPELGASGRVAHEELAVSSLEEEVGVAARQQPRGCRRSVGWRAERLLVLGQDPPVSVGRVHRCQRCRERLERRPATRGLDPRPLRERLGCRRREDTEIPAREPEPGLDRINLRPGTVQITGCRAPSQRISTRPVGAA